MVANDFTPFDELPEALVEDMLKECDNLNKALKENFNNLQKEKEPIRKKLEKKKLLRIDSDIRGTARIPTTCGVDGSYYVDKLLSVDIVGTAAVAVEGLTPPYEKRHWPRPKHIPFVKSCIHSEATSLLVRALMMTYELELAAKAPHDVVFLDGSLTTPIIYFNQALQKLNEEPSIISKTLANRFPDCLNNYKEILLSKRTDKIYVAIPKYSTRKEIANEIDNKSYDDRSLLTFILKTNEYTTPLSLEKPTTPWHMNVEKLTNSGECELIAREIEKTLNEIHVFYYRPKSWLPAMRMEISKSISKNNQRLAILLEGMQYQCTAPGVMEPYPTYMADRMVKNMSTALPAIRKHVTQEMMDVDVEDDEINDIYLGMHAYRS